MLQIRTKIFINPLNMKFCVLNMQISFKNKLQISEGCTFGYDSHTLKLRHQTVHFEAQHVYIPQPLH